MPTAHRAGCSGGPFWRPTGETGCGGARRSPRWSARRCLCPPSCPLRLGSTPKCSTSVGWPSDVGPPRDLGRKSLLLVTATWLASALGFVSTLLVARRLGPEALGALRSEEHTSELQSRE